MRHNAKGFTLVELALSMVFVGILSLAIALIIVDTTQSYKRGLTLNQINTVGMDLVDDMRSAVQNSSATGATRDCQRYYGTLNDAYDSSGKVSETSSLYYCQQDGAYNFVYLTKYSSEIKLMDGDREKDTLKNVPIYGAFCTGTYSYLWNSGYYESEEARFDEKDNEWAKLVANVNGEWRKYYGTSRNGSNVGYVTQNGGGAWNSEDSNLKPFRLLKVRDDYRAVCAGVTRTAEVDGSGYRYDNSYQPVEGSIDKRNDNYNGEFQGVFSMVGYQSLGDEEPVDLIITDKTGDLAIYDLYVPRPAESSTQKNSFYAPSFILGTVNGGVNILAHGKSCEAPNDYNKLVDFDYCAINKFSFAAQVGGE